MSATACTRPTRRGRRRGRFSLAARAGAVRARRQHDADQRSSRGADLSLVSPADRFRRSQPVALRPLWRVPGLADPAPPVFASLRPLPAPAGPLMSTTADPVPPCPPGADQHANAVGPDRPPRALHRHPLSHGARSVGSWSPSCSASLRPASRPRCRAPAGKRAARSPCRRASSSNATSPASAAMGLRPSSTRRRRPSARRRSPSAIARVEQTLRANARGAHGRCASARPVDLPRRPHGDRAGGRRARTPTKWSPPRTG